MKDLSYKQAIDAVLKFIKLRSLELTPTQNQTLLEIKRRLERLDVQMGKLVGINEKLMQKEDIKSYFDSDTNTYTVSSGGKELKIRLKRADPNVPITMTNLTKGNAYDAGSAIPLDEEHQKLRVQLESELESYYQSAHKILKLFGTIPDLAKIKSLSVTRIRNNLIEHTKIGSTYTFGVGSTGPRVKPMYKGELVFNDEGLLPNTQEFINAIVSVCNKST